MTPKEPTAEARLDQATRNSLLAEIETQRSKSVLLQEFETLEAFAEKSGVQVKPVTESRAGNSDYFLQKVVILKLVSNPYCQSLNKCYSVLNEKH